MTDRHYERVTRMARPKVRKLARQGRLMDEAFKAFRHAIVPDAPEHQVADMRAAFMAGASELFTLVMAQMDPGPDETEAEMDFLSHVQGELHTFSERMIRQAMEEPE